MKREWKPTTFKEFTKELGPTEKMNPFMKIVHLIGYSIFHFVYWQPSFLLCLCIFINYPSLEVGGLALLVFIAENRIRFIDSNYFISRYALKEIYLFFIETVLPNKYELIEFDINEILGSENIEKFKPLRFAATAKRNKSILSRVFWLRSNADVIGQDKGFALPIAFNREEVYPYSLSMIFLNSNPTSMSLREVFTLYHELGHTTKFNFYIKTRFVQLLMLSLLLLVMLILSSNYIFWSLIFLFLYFFIRFRFSNPISTIKDEELLADCLAILKMPDTYLKGGNVTQVDWDKLNKVLTRLFKLNSTGKSWITDDRFKQIRIQYISELIEERKKGNFDVSFYVHVNRPLRSILVRSVFVVLCSGMCACLDFSRTNFNTLTIAVSIFIFCSFLAQFINKIKIQHFTEEIENFIVKLKLDSSNK